MNTNLVINYCALSCFINNELKPKLFLIEKADICDKKQILSSY